MFNTPFKLRSWTKPCTPKGPDYSSTKKHIITLSGTKLTLSYPNFRPRSFDHVHTPKSQYNLETLNLEPFSSDNNQWLYAPLLKGIWTFNGPMFLGWMANVECYINIVERSQKIEASLFHPRVFESSLLELIAIQYSNRDEETFSQQLYHAPMNWTPVKNIQPPAVQFIAKANRKLRPNAPNHNYLYIAISNEHLLSISTSIHSRVKYEAQKPVRNNEFWLSPEPMEDFIEKLVNSITIELSDEAHKQMIEAQVGLENTSLTEKFPPVNVIEYEKKIGLK